MCIPGISVELKNLLNRLESVCGKLHFYQKQDQDLSNEANNEVNEDCADCISGLEEDGNIQAQLKPTASGGKSQGLRAAPQRDALSSDKLKALIARKIQEIRRRKNLIVQLHGGQTRSVLVDQNIGIRGFELQFDARYEIGRMTILAKVFSLPSSVVDSFCMDFDSLRERFRSEKVVLHLLLYFRKQISPDLRKEWVARIQLMTSQYESIQIYFYSVSEDNSVKPLG